MDLADLQARLQQFADERDWNRFHSPKNLAMALSVEAAELVEIFQWLTEDESRRLNDVQKGAAADEVADVLIYLARFAAMAGIDVDAAVASKLARNAVKYPVRR